LGEEKNLDDDYDDNDIYLLQFGFHPVAAVCELGQYSVGETIHTAIQKHRIQKIENKNTKKKTNTTKILINIRKNAQNNMQTIQKLRIHKIENKYT